jgi:hypothetical protein
MAYINFQDKNIFDTRNGKLVYKVEEKNMTDPTWSEVFWDGISVDDVMYHREMVRMAMEKKPKTVRVRFQQQKPVHGGSAPVQKSRKKLERKRPKKRTRRDVRSRGKTRFESRRVTSSTIDPSETNHVEPEEPVSKNVAINRDIENYDRCACCGEGDCTERVTNYELDRSHPLFRQPMCEECHRLEVCRCCGGWGNTPCRDCRRDFN